LQFDLVLLESADVANAFFSGRDIFLPKLFAPANISLLSFHFKDRIKVGKGKYLLSFFYIMNVEFLKKK
jgi:hypothetical protein